MTPKISHIFLLTAPKHSGKTTAAKKLTELAKQNNLSPAGILAPSIYKDSKLIGFKILDIKTSRQTLLFDFSDETKRELTFTKKGLKFGDTALSIENLKDADLIILDEFGPLELNNKGWRKQFDTIIKQFNIPIIIITRSELAPDVQRIYNIPNKNILDLNISLTDVINRKPQIP